MSEEGPKVKETELDKLDRKIQAIQQELHREYQVGVNATEFEIKTKFRAVFMLFQKAGLFTEEQMDIQLREVILEEFEIIKAQVIEDRKAQSKVQLPFNAGKILGPNGQPIDGGGGI